MHREFAAAHADWPVIPQASIVERMALECAPLATYAASTPAAKAFAALWLAVEAGLGAATQPKAKESGRALARIPKASKRKTP
jgi:hypothetical protein